MELTELFLWTMTAFWHMIAGQVNNFLFQHFKAHVKEYPSMHWNSKSHSMSEKV